MKNALQILAEKAMKSPRMIEFWKIQREKFQKGKENVSQKNRNEGRSST